MTEQPEAAVKERIPRGGSTKAATVQKLLSRPKGATLAEITVATGWLAHSIRAFMTSLCKRGHDLVRECRINGETSWRIER